MLVLEPDSYFGASGSVVNGLAVFSGVAEGLPSAPQSVFLDAVLERYGEAALVQVGGYLLYLGRYLASWCADGGQANSSSSRCCKDEVIRDNEGELGQTEEEEDQEGCDEGKLDGSDAAAPGVFLAR